MAEGISSDCEIVPTGNGRTFHFRVKLSSSPSAKPLHKTTVLAGCSCAASYLSQSSTGNIRVAINVHSEPALEAAAKVSTHMVLLDKTGSPAPSIGRRKTVNFSFPGYIDGCCYMLIARRDDVKANCVVDNYFVALCSVDINWIPPVSPILDLGHDLAMMFDNQDLTDVSFDVGGESFGAHRLVLAARSPVFKAELYGPMAESIITSITIQDMEASTFRSMLHYMYQGSLPNADRNGVSSTVAHHQHLLVAADRYRVKELKKICEYRLCGSGIMIDNVVSMLQLAEDHACLKLKTECLDFLANGENFKMVATSAEYLRLMQSFPSLLVEMRNRFKMVHKEPTTMNHVAHKKSRVC